MKSSIGIGLMTRQLEVRAIGGRMPRMGGVAWGSCITSLYTAIFYVIILAWAILYFIASFQSPLPWADPAKARDYFIKDVARQTTGPALVEGPKRFNSNTYLALIALMVLVFLSMHRGENLMGKITYIVMLIPMVLLVLLAILGMSLDGGLDGVKQYIATFDYKVYWEKPDIFPAAATQAFFSTSVGYGILTSFASKSTDNANAGVDTTVIIVADFLCAFIAGFAVWGVLGFTAKKLNVPINSLESAGPNLVFITYPVGLAQLPVGQLWCIIFFIILLMLGIDSVFAQVSAGVSWFRDSCCMKRRPLFWSILFGTVIILAASFFYSWDTGMVMINQTDWFSGHVCAQVFAYTRAIAFGWTYKYEELVPTTNSILSKVSLIVLMVFWMGGIFLGSVLALTLKGSMVGVGIGVGVFLALIGFPLSIGIHLWVSKREGSALPVKEQVYNLLLGSVEALRKDLNGFSKRSDLKWVRTVSLDQMTIVWSVVYRYFIPAAGIVLFSLDFKSLIEGWDATPHLIPYKIYGACLAGFLVLVAFGTLVWPNNPLMKVLLDPVEDNVKVEIDLDRLEDQGSKNEDKSMLVV
eukprot:Filipodium_phascolosomae@DN650_c0_g1_i1.p1